MDLNQRYFMMSFRFNRTKPEEFGLTQRPEHPDLLEDAEGGLWRAAELHDLGWGPEVGFARQPELTFDDLWSLLLASNLEENRLGAASRLLERHPDQLLPRLEALVSSTTRIDSNTKRALRALELSTPENRSATVGKTIAQITQDADRWRALSEEVRRVSRPWWKVW